MIHNNLMRFHENNNIITSLKEFTGSYLSIPNTINAPIERLEISGVSSQIVTVQGKNLFRQTALPQTQAGVTLSYDSVTGEFILNGTSTGPYSFEVVPARVRTLFTMIANSLYTTSIRTTGGTSSKEINVLLNTDTENIVTMTLNTPSTLATKATTPIADKNISRLALNMGSSGIVYNNYRIAVQTELGTVTAFAPFVPNSPSPYYPSVITNVVNPTLTITDTHTSHITNLLGTLRSLPNGVCDKIIIDKSTLTAWIERNITTATLASGNSWNIANAKANSSYRSTNLASGNLTGTTLTSTVAVPTSFEVDYELAALTVESITYPSLETIQYLTNISTNSALNPSIKAKVRVLGN